MSSPVKFTRGPKVGAIRREINFWFDDRKELTHIFNRHRASSKGRYASKFYDDTKAGIRKVLLAAMLKRELGSVIKKVTVDEAIKTSAAKMKKKF